MLLLLNGIFIFNSPCDHVFSHLNVTSFWQDTLFIKSCVISSSDLSAYMNKIYFFFIPSHAKHSPVCS